VFKTLLITTASDAAPLNRMDIQGIQELLFTLHALELNECVDVLRHLVSLVLLDSIHNSLSL